MFVAGSRPSGTRAPSPQATTRVPGGSTRDRVATVEGRSAGISSLRSRVSGALAVRYFWAAWSNAKMSYAATTFARRRSRGTSASTSAGLAEATRTMGASALGAASEWRFRRLTPLLASSPSDSNAGPRSPRMASAASAPSVAATASHNGPQAKVAKVAPSSGTEVIEAAASASDTIRSVTSELAKRPRTSVRRRANGDADLNADPGSAFATAGILRPRGLGGQSPASQVSAAGGGARPRGTRGWLRRIGHIRGSLRSNVPRRAQLRFLRKSLRSGASRRVRPRPSQCHHQVTVQPPIARLVKRANRPSRTQAM